MIDVKQLAEMWAAVDPEWAFDCEWVMSQAHHDELGAMENRRRGELAKSSGFFVYKPIDASPVGLELVSHLFGMRIRIADVAAIALQRR